MRRSLKWMFALGLVGGLTIVGWFFARDDDWYQSLIHGEQATQELPSDLTEVFNTAIVTRDDVADANQLDAALSYIDRVEFAHRVDPRLATTTTTEEGTGGRGAATQTTTTIEVPGVRAVTDLPDVGRTLSPGDILYETDSTPVMLASGEVAAWRTMNIETSGADVAQLQQALVDGGYDPDVEVIVDGVWSSATSIAVELWQADNGQEVSGEVALGDIWFVQGPIRIVDVTATVGAQVTDGDPVLTYTSDVRLVEVSVSTLPDGLLTARDLSVRLPSGSTAAGDLTGVRGTPTGFDLIIEVDLAGEEIDEFDQLPVTVVWTVNELVDELTVPPEAIRRLDTGGYVVDVLDGDSIIRTPVEVIGQAGRVVAISGVVERAVVLLP